MTGRRLYDTLSDAWSHEPLWARDYESNGMFRPLPPAWAFLTVSEREAFNRAARSLTVKRRRA